MTTVLSQWVGLGSGGRGLVLTDFRLTAEQRMATGTNKTSCFVGGADSPDIFDRLSAQQVLFTDLGVELGS